MLIANLSILEEFMHRHPPSRKPLLRWIRVAKGAKWKHLIDIKSDFNSVDYINDIYIFDIKGNSYRLITEILFVSQIIFILYVRTHSEYDRIKFDKKNILKFRHKFDQ
jgi:mRNA interferase HigB